MNYRFDKIAFNSTAKKTPTESDKKHYIGLEHIDSECLEITRWGSDVAPIGEKLIMKKGDVLFGKRRAYQRKLAIAPFDGIFSAHGMVLRPNEEVVDKNYFPFFMSSDLFMERAVQISVGGLSPTINWKDLREQEFPLPSLAEQKVLADKLWAAYRLKESYKKLLAATEEMVKSQFIEMLGDPIKNTKKLLSRKGEELFVFSSGKANTKSNLSNDFPYNCYGGNGITGHSNQWLIDYPTIVIGRVGEYCGCVHKTQGKVWITDNAIYIKEHKKNVFDDAFLFYLMTYLDFHRLADETGQPKITQRPLLDMEYIIPSKDLQQKFISIAEQADKSGFELRKSIDAIDAVIKSLINN